MIRTIALIACLAAAVATTGCSKKKQTEASSSDSAVTLPEVAANKDSTDIFDEFYNDNKAEAATGTSASSPAKNAPKPAAARSAAPISTPVASAENLDPNGRYVVQVASVMSEQLANSIVQKLKAKGLPAYISTIENPTPELIGTYFRVRVGGFAGITAAKAFGQKYLAGDGYEYWVASRGDEGTGGIGLGGSQ